jgi:hypothetical protein
MDDIIINKNFDTDNIRFEISNNNIFTQKIIPYNGSCKIAMHKIWLLIDSVKLINNYIFNDKNVMTITMTPLNENINIIEKIENTILEKIKKLSNNDDIILKSKFYNNKDYIIKFDIIYNNSTPFFDELDKSISIDELKDDINFSIICELTEMIFNNKILAIYWKAIQIKQNKKIDLSKSLFSLKYDLPIIQSTYTESKDDIHIIDKNIPKKTAFVPHQSDLGNFNLKKNSNNEISISIDKPKTAFILTPDLLNSVKGRLNKINTENKKIEEKEVCTNIPKLNHVITKEPISMFDILKEEYLSSKIENIYNLIIDENEIYKKTIGEFKKHRKKAKKIKSKMSK